MPLNQSYFASCQPQNEFVPVVLNNIQNDAQKSNFAPADLSKSVAPVLQKATYYVNYTYCDMNPASVGDRV